MRTLPKINPFLSKKLGFGVAAIMVTITSIALKIIQLSNDTHNIQQQQYSQALDISQLFQIKQDFEYLSEIQKQQIHELEKQMVEQSTQLNMTRQKNSEQFEQLVNKLSNVDESLTILITEFNILKQGFTEFKQEASGVPNLKISTSELQQQVEQLKINLNDSKSEIKVIWSKLEDINKDLLEIPVLDSSVNALKIQVSSLEVQAPMLRDTLGIQQTILTSLIQTESDISRRVDLAHDEHNQEMAKMSINLSGMNNLTSILSTRIDTLQTKLDTPRGQTSLSGPFYELSANLVFYSGQNWQKLSTTQPCILKNQKKGIVRLEAQGHSYCENCYGQILFMKDGVNPQTAIPSNELLYGSAIIQNIVQPISLVQEFIVDPGTYEFALYVWASEGKKLTVSRLLFVMVFTEFD